MLEDTLQAKFCRLSPAHHVTLGTHCVNFNHVFQTLDSILCAVLVALANLVFSHILQAARLIFVYASLGWNAVMQTRPLLLGKQIATSC